MFTGIVEELGRLTRRTDGQDSSRVEISGPTVVPGLAHGDSVAVDGVCLTVAEVVDDGFVADVMAETLAVQCGAGGADVPVPDLAGTHRAVGELDGGRTVTILLKRVES